VVHPFILVCGSSSVLLQQLLVLLVASGRLGDRVASGKGRDGETEHLKLWVGGTVSRQDGESESRRWTASREDKRSEIEG
jgi:hypothetical protein